MNRNLEFFFFYNENKKLRNDIFEIKDPLEIDGKIETIGSGSAYGFVSVIKLKDLNLNLVFKCTKDVFDPDANIFPDNNFYEFFVGTRMNTFKQFVPNFVHTFNHAFLSETLKRNIRIQNFDNNVAFVEGLQFQNLTFSEHVKMGCLLNHRSGFFMEMVPQAIEFYKIFYGLRKRFMDPEETLPENLNYTVFVLLFQVYAALFILRNHFTHYDLNTNNVMFITLEEPVDIQYNIGSGLGLEIGPRIIKIRTRIISVFIDYASAFVEPITDSDSKMGSKDFMDMACSIKECNEEEIGKRNCNLRKVGLRVMESESESESKSKSESKIHYKNPILKNESHDLRFLVDFLKYFEKDETFQSLLIFKKIKSIFNNINNPEWYVSKNVIGVPEQARVKGKIKTVQDFFEFLVLEIEPETSYSRDFFTSEPFIQLDIYDDLKTRFKTTMLRDSISVTDFFASYFL